MTDTSEKFYESLPVFDNFEGVTNNDNYRPLPDDWALVTGDIVDSTGAIRDGSYKIVNMTGAAIISAVLNAVGIKDLPFVFAGDGATIAIPASGVETARAAVSAVRTWASEEMGLDMRAAIIPLSEIRKAGRDVLVARFKVSENASYAMFAGGGASWAESRMKEGAFSIPRAPSGERPDLKGLSCRWSPIPSRHGEIVSIIAVPVAGSDEAAFRELIREIVAVASSEERGGHPVPASGPTPKLTRQSLEWEARTRAGQGSKLMQKLAILGQYHLGNILALFNMKLGDFDARRYKSDVSDNSDFRKFDDGLKMTVDVDRARLSRIEMLLKDAAARGICRYGLHSQDTALITCFVANPMERDHMHFIDGAAGGYALAAAKLKETLRGEVQPAPVTP
jgi:predicted NUDIX family NTP pyrophosphohydrolase